MSIRVGIIGLHHGATVHLPAYAASAKYEVSAVCDLVSSLADKTAPLVGDSMLKFGGVVSRVTTTLTTLPFPKLLAATTEMVFRPSSNGQEVECEKQDIQDDN